MTNSKPSRESALEGAIEILTTETENHLVCVFNAQHYHLFASGKSRSETLSPCRLEGVDVYDAFDNHPRVATHLAANYTAALDGDIRERELCIDDKTFAVSTRPLPGEHGLAEFTAVASDDRERVLNDDAKHQFLYDTTSELEAVKNRDELYSIAVKAAERILTFDACVFAETTDEGLEAITGAANTLETDDGFAPLTNSIAGRTFNENQTIYISDTSTSDEQTLTNTKYRSILSIPMPEHGVFQAATTARNGFHDTERELGEILITQVTNALSRVKYERTITHERDHFAALFQNIPDAAVRYTFDGGSPRITRVNSAFIGQFGYDPKDAIGELVTDLLVPDPDIDAVKATYERVKKGERLDYEAERMTATGLNPFLVRSVPVSTVSDDANEGYIIYTDISTLKERERELQQKNERLDTFASVVSHDLRNPINVAQGYLELARENGDAEHFDIIGENLEYMEEMIEELLTLARDGSMISDRQTVSLAAIAETAWSHVDTAKGTLDIKGTVELDADSDRIQELLENLFRNAVEHGGADVTVTVSPTKHGFYVADDGPGISSDDVENVFDMGFSTNSKGTGFGLAIVAAIAEAHGWTISAGNSNAGGARFDIDTTESPPADEPTP